MQMLEGKKEVEKEIPVKKNEEYVVEIMDHGYEGEGIAKIDDFTIFVPKAIKGEKVRIKIVKVLTSHAFAKVMEIIEKSEHRQIDDCNSYKRCGGCNLRHMDYEMTLNIKQNTVKGLLQKTFGKDKKVEVGKTIGMGNPYHYRNKAQYPFGRNMAGEVVWGVFAERSHEIVPIKDCQIQSPEAEQIAFSIYQFMKVNQISAYDEKTGEGLVRHLVVKVGVRSHEIMCILVLNGYDIPMEKELVTMLKERFPAIKTIVKNTNRKNTNVILGNENTTIYGDGYIVDSLGDYTFKMSPMSFYQVNSVQAELLYHLAIELAELKKEDVLFDLYCGIGTIGIFASSYVKKVYGIEIVGGAIEDAKENARINGVYNIEFLAGDVEKTLTKLLERSVFPDVVIVDPPRKGLDGTTIMNLLSVEPKKIVYISCNPATMVRDLKLLEEKYEFDQVQPVDMFPFTSHVECCSVLYLKN